MRREGAPQHLACHFVEVGELAEVVVGRADPHQEGALLVLGAESGEDARGRGEELPGEAEPVGGPLHQRLDPVGRVADVVECTAEPKDESAGGLLLIRRQRAGTAPAGNLILRAVEGGRSGHGANLARPRGVFPAQMGCARDHPSGHAHGISGARLSNKLSTPYNIDTVHNFLYHCLITL